MYKIYWLLPGAGGTVWKAVPEEDVKSFIDSLDRLGFPVAKIEME